MTVFGVPISIVSISIAIISTGILSMSNVSIITMPMSTVSINTMPMAIVTIPVSICNAIVNEGAIFIFTELVDELRLQCLKKKKCRNQLCALQLKVIIAMYFNEHTAAGVISTTSDCDYYLVAY